MATEIRHIKVDPETRIEQLLKETGTDPVIVELGDAAYRINPVGATSSPFTVESAYASVRTADGRTGADISDEELEALIAEAKADLPQRILEQIDVDV
jgi:hypothetical protein